MYRYEDIRHVHLEPSSRCNAACPMCTRNSRGATASGLPLTELSLEQVRAIFPEDFLARLTGMELCGSYGDPMMASSYPDIVAYVRAANPECVITTYTNGGMRLPRWWAEVARILGARARVVFAIDGLADTNGVYRRGVRFDRAMANARAFIDAGGTATWDYLAFRHNEHQIEEARALSQELGFANFKVKHTGRFLDSLFDYVPEFDGHDDLTRFPIYAPDGTVVDYLQPTSESAWTPDAAERYAARVREPGALDAVLADSAVRCRVAEKKSVFVSAQGYAFPCPWTYVQATRPDLSGFPASANRQVSALLAASGGLDGLDTMRAGLRGVVEGAFFTAVESSWSCASVDEGKLKVCARTCGVGVAEYLKQFDDHKPMAGRTRSSLPLYQPVARA